MGLISNRFKGDVYLIIGLEGHYLILALIWQSRQYC